MSDDRTVSLSNPYLKLVIMWAVMCVFVAAAYGSFTLIEHGHNILHERLNK